MDSGRTLDNRSKWLIVAGAVLLVVALFGILVWGSQEQSPQSLTLSPSDDLVLTPISAMATGQHQSGFLLLSSDAIMEVGLTSGTLPPSDTTLYLISNTALQRLPQLGFALMPRAAAEAQGVVAGDLIADKDIVLTASQVLALKIDPDVDLTVPLPAPDSPPLEIPARATLLGLDQEVESFLDQLWLHGVSAKGTEEIGVIIRSDYCPNCGWGGCCSLCWLCCAWNGCA